MLQNMEYIGISFLHLDFFPYLLLFVVPCKNIRDFQWWDYLLPFVCDIYIYIYIFYVLLFKA